MRVDGSGLLVLHDPVADQPGFGIFLGPPDFSPAAGHWYIFLQWASVLTLCDDYNIILDTCGISMKKLLKQQ